MLGPVRKHVPNPSPADTHVQARRRPPPPPPPTQPGRGPPWANRQRPRRSYAAATDWPGKGELHQPPHHARGSELSSTVNQRQHHGEHQGGPEQPPAKGIVRACPRGRAPTRTGTGGTVGRRPGGWRHRAGGRIVGSWSSMPRNAISMMRVWSGFFVGTTTGAGSGHRAGGNGAVPRPDREEAPPRGSLRGTAGRANRRTERLPSRAHREDRRPHLDRRGCGAVAPVLRESPREIAKGWRAEKGPGGRLSAWLLLGAFAGVGSKNGS